MPEDSPAPGAAPVDPNAATVPVPRPAPAPADPNAPTAPIARPADAATVAIPRPIPVISPERPGDFIEHYKLIKELGVGGFGIVWRAEQTEPIHREVALKVIKPGMDSREVIARFEAERQALALMDHPNIAKVLDAGASSTGRPYFVMELVPGLRLTEFCDEIGRAHV